MIHPTIKLSLEVDVSLGLELPEGFAEALSNTFAEWSDGRKLYSVELAEDGLSRAIENAIHKSLSAKFHALYPREMVPTGRGSETAKSALATDEAMAGMYVRIREIACASATPIKDDPESR